MSELAIRQAGAEIRITFAFSIALIVQSALGLIWAGAAANRIDQLERRVNASEEMIERTARLEEQMAGMRASLMRIEAKLDRQNVERGK
jgi:hypothetical protein